MSLEKNIEKLTVAIEKLNKLLELKSGEVANIKQVNKKPIEEAVEPYVEEHVNTFPFYNLSDCTNLAKILVNEKGIKREDIKTIIKSLGFDSLLDIESDPEAVQKLHSKLTELNK